MDLPASKTSEAASSLLAEGDRLFKLREYAEAGTQYQEAVKAAEEAGDNETLTEALAQTARSSLNLDQKDDGWPWLKRAEAIATEDEPRGWSRYLGVRGRFEWKEDTLATATKTFEVMYAYCMGRELFDRAIDAAHMVAITAPAEVQIEWAIKGIAAAKAAKAHGWLGPLWNNLGWTYSDLGRHDEALDALKHAHTYHHQTGSDHAKLIADWSLGVAHRKLGQLKEAREWLEPVLEWATRRYAEDSNMDRAEWVGFAHRALGETAADENDWPTALAELEHAREYLEIARMPEWDEDAFAHLNTQITEAEAQASGG